MKIKRLVFIMLLLGSFMGIAKAQDGNNINYYLPNLPQRVHLNPAYQPEYKVWVGLPALSGISVNYLNSSFGVEDIIRKGGKDSLYVDMNRMYKSLRKRNFFHVNNENSILTVGVKAKSWYGTLEVSQKNDFVFRINKDVFTFLKNGNADYVGKTLDLGKLGLKGSMYDEFAFGLSKKVNDKLTVGARAKFLLGIANVDMINSELTVHTRADGSALELHSKQDIRISAPVTLSENVELGQPIDWDEFDMELDDFTPSMVLNTKNPGFGLDMGAEYQFNEKLKLYASIVDLGFIRWGAKGYRLQQDTRFDWEGADLSNSANPNAPDNVDLDDVFNDLLDSLKNNFRLIKGEGAYTTMLRTKFYAGGTYELTKMFNVGGLLHMTMMNKIFYPTFTASAGARFHRNVSAAVSYTLMPGNWVNVGAGITAKLGPMQLYASTDNVLAANYTKTQAVNLNFGINLLMGHKDRKKKVKKEETIIAPVVVPIKKPEPVVKKDTAEEVAVPPVVNEPLPEVVVEQPKAPVVVPEETVVKNDRQLLKSYHVILGSFKNEQSAEKLKDMLVSKGLPDCLVFQSEKGLYRVSAMSFDSEEEGMQKVMEIRSKYPKYNDAWLLKIN